jgi:hypothetical protein
MEFTNATAPVARFVKLRMDEHLKKQNAETKDPARRDFLLCFMEAGEKDPAFIDIGRVLSLTAANMFIESNTTAISLRSIFYFLLKNLDKLRELR